MRRGAFTVLELLVVIAVIGLLVAITQPCLQSARHYVRRAVCGSNIRQLLLGLATYETENERYPYSFNDIRMDVPPGGYAGYGSIDMYGWWWFDYVGGFYKKSDRKKSVLECPAKKLKRAGLRTDILCGNYGVNQSICRMATHLSKWADFIGKPLRSVDISSPGQTLLIVDSGYSMINWNHATDTPGAYLDNTWIEDTAYVPGLKINKERELWAGQEEDAIHGRHPNRTVNVGFVDGHISCTKADELFIERAADGCYRNRTPLWVPK